MTNKFLCLILIVFVLFAGCEAKELQDVGLMTTEIESIKDMESGEIIDDQKLVEDFAQAIDRCEFEIYSGESLSGHRLYQITYTDSTVINFEVLHNQLCTDVGCFTTSNDILAVLENIFN